jgi:hypothetical protein
MLVGVFSMALESARVSTRSRSETGKLKGTTLREAANDLGFFSSTGCGTVLAMTPAGVTEGRVLALGVDGNSTEQTTLVAFDGTGGERSFSALVQSTNGAFYANCSPRKQRSVL